MSAPRPTWFRPMALTLGASAALLAVAMPFVPETYRPWNFAAFGAIGVFVAARAGLVPALLLALGAKLAFDVLNYVGHDMRPDYQPMGIVYVGYAIYPLLGLLLRRTEQPLKIVGVAAAAGVPFFLITNFHAWLSHSLPYPMTAAGLLECYEMALPFHRPTLASDLAFSVALFAAHAVLSRVAFPAERVNVECVVQ